MRKEKNIHYIYKTTCNVTGRWYIGMHSTCNENDSYMGSGLRLRRSIRKYGVENHTKEILEYCNSREELVLREIEIVTKELISDDKCMNLKEGGCGGFVNEKHRLKCQKSSRVSYKKHFDSDDDFRNKMLTVMRNNFNKAYEEGKFNGYSNFEGKLHSEESKQLMSEKRKGVGIGETNSQYNTCWITKDGENKKIFKGDELPEGWRLGRKISK